MNGTPISRSEIGRRILNFVGNDPEPIFWADYGAYDFVVLSQIYGPLVNRPKGWPMFVRDIQNFKQLLGVEEFPEFPHQEHNALDDAYEVKFRWTFLKQIAEGADPKELFDRCNKHADWVHAIVADVTGAEESLIGSIPKDLRLPQ